MPSNPESLLISSILRDRDYTVTISAGVKDEMFKGYGDEWHWLSDYYTKHKRVPSKAAFLNQFPDFRVKMVNDTEHFCDEVRQAHARRQLTRTMKDGAGFLAEGDLENALALFQTSVIKIGASMGHMRDSNFLDDWELVYKDVEARKERFDKYGMAGIPTGFTTFDERTGGVAPGQVTIVASRLGQKKSWTLMRMATACLTQGFTAHYSSLEMSKAEVGMRMHNMLSGTIGKQVFRAIDLLQGKDFDLQEYKAFLRGLRNNVQGSLTISDTRNIGLPEIAAQIERYNPDVYFLDYLTLAKIGGDGGWKAIGDFTKGLKDIGGETNTSIVAAAQLNRMATQSGGHVGPEHLGGSDHIGQDADTVIMLKTKSETISEYRVSKLRHGRDNFGWFAKLDTDRGIFQEVTYEEAMAQIERDKDHEDLKHADKKKVRQPDPTTDRHAAFGSELRVVGSGRKSIRRA